MMMKINQHMTVLVANLMNIVNVMEGRDVRLNHRIKAV